MVGLVQELFPGQYRWHYTHAVTLIVSYFKVYCCEISYIFININKANPLFSPIYSERFLIT